MNLDFIAALRQNHALEHATIALLSKRLEPETRLAGRASLDGYYIYGDVPTEEIEEAAAEGLARLQAGQVGLAVSPFCGTNVVIAGTMAAIASLIALRGGGRWHRLPNAMLAASAAVMLAQPLGRLAQIRLTTVTDLSSVIITGVHRSGSGRATRHHITTSR